MSNAFIQRMFEEHNASVEELSGNRYKLDYSGVVFIILDERTEKERKNGTRNHEKLTVVDVTVKRTEAGRFKVISQGYVNFAPFTDHVTNLAKEDPRKREIEERIARVQAELEKAREELSAL